jgi:enoyl-CoA hydratase
MPIRPSLELETLRLVMDDEAHGNAFSQGGAEELSQALRAMDGSFRELVMSARGRFFCAGGNLDEYAKMKDAESGRAANREIARGLDLLQAVPRPTLALVQGDCVGGGLELLGCFDRVIAVPEACFGFWQRRVGLSFGWGGGARLAERLTPKRLRLLASDAATITAGEALEIGLIDEIALSSQLEARGQAWIRRMRRWAQAPLVAQKAEARGERALFEGLWWAPEHRTALFRRLKN